MDRFTKNIAHSSHSLAPTRSPGDSSIKSPSRARRKPPPDLLVPEDSSAHTKSPNASTRSPTPTFYETDLRQSVSPNEARSEFQFGSSIPSQLNPSRSPGVSTPSDTNVAKTNKFERDFNDIIHNIETEIDNFNIDTSGRDYDDASSSVYDTDSPAKMSRSSINDPFSLGRDANEPLQNPLYANSTTSISSTPAPSIPYPLDSPIAPSPTGSTFESYQTPDNNVYPISGVPISLETNSTLYPLDSTDSDNTRFNYRPTNFSPGTNPAPYFNRTNSQATTSTQKSNPLKPTISTPITNLATNSTANNSTTDSLRQTPPSTSANTFTNSSTPNNFNNSGINGGQYTSSSSMYNSKFGHRKSSSISSILSTSSAKNVNLATLKKTLNLRPGEGERSSYVLTIRRNAGTAYNESGPGKWKLPTGIAPIDKRTTYTSSNGKYMRIAGGMSQNKLKKASGVELKHGHLAPRLLAAEVDDTDDNSLKLKPTKIENGDNHDTTGTNTPKTKSSNSSLLMTPGAASINSNVSSGNNTLSRTITENSVSSVSNKTPKDSSSESRTRSESVNSDSSGSINDANVGFYQHPGYKYQDAEGNAHEGDEYKENEDTVMDEESFEEYRDQPKLVLANPDTDSE